MAAGSFLLLSIGLYWLGAVQQLTQLNQDLSSNDQQAYMVYASNLATSKYTFVGDRNRMPVYPLFQSLFYRPGLTDEAFFTQGKYINLTLSLFLLAAVGFVFYQHLPQLVALNLLLITAFTVFVFKAGYFQVELLFYTLIFVLFLLFWRLLHQPSWGGAVLTGVVAGVTHLTKASVLPGLALFVILGLAQGGWTIWQRRQTNAGGWIDREGGLQLGSVVLTVGLFLLTVSPYIITSKQIFGHYFYNVNSTFYMWYDSWGEATQGTKAHGDRVGWPTMPPEEIPSMSKYFREHTAAQVIGRLVNGGQTVWQGMTQSYGYFKYIVIYAILFVVMLWMNRQQLYQKIKDNLVVTLFVIGYFVGYLLLYAWYVPIASGNRFVLALFLPMLFTLAYTSCCLGTAAPAISQYWIHLVRTRVQMFLLCFIAVDVYFVLTIRIFTIYGGR